MVDVQKPTGRYVYCIIQSEEPQHFTLHGVGEYGDNVRTVHFRDLAAVVSDSPTIEYENTRRNMMAHTTVLEEVMRDHALLPVRFGTVAPDEEAIRERVIKRRFGEFHGLLNEMAGQVELGLKAFWYEQVIFQEILEENPAIRSVRDSLMDRSPEETYYNRIRLGEMIEKAMWDKRSQDSETILSRLRPLVRRTRANKVITDRMVLNAAFLLDAARQAEFDAVVEELDQELGERMMFKYVGPVPPYNFVNLVVTWN